MSDNILYNIGDVLIVNVNSQITGRVSLTSFVETITGETATRTLKREFRVSSDNVLWSEWSELTNANLSAEDYIADGFLTIQIRYTRGGSDNTGEIEFQNITFDGTRGEIKFIAPTISSSIFDEIIGQTETKKLEENLFKKLYFNGIIAKYLIRAENRDRNEDKDYVDLWSSVARFFAMIVRFFKRFENFNSDFDLMREQIRQYGIYFDESEVTLDELQYLASHLYDEIRKRGTKLIFARKGYTLPSGNTVKIDGEFIRLLRNEINDELLYENIPLSKVGWCMNQASPMYKGTAQAYELNKTPENTQDFQDLSNFNLNKTNSSSYHLETHDNRKVLTLISTSGICGIGRTLNAQPISKLIKVDTKIDYEITFAFKIISGKSSSVKLKFGVEGFDSLKTELNDSFITPNGNVVSELFFEKQTTNLKTNCWYYARGIIHAYSTMPVVKSLTNLGFGNNLYFNNPFVKFISPIIQLSSQGVSAEVKIWDYKVRPLIRGKNIIPLKDGTINSRSLGFIESSRFFYTYVKNNNNSQTNDEITDIIEKYLYPYDTTNIFEIISNS